MRFLACLFALLAPAAACGQTGGVQLSVSVASRTVTEPFPASITLRFHNSGQETLWLYQPARDPSAVEWESRFAPEASSDGPAATQGGTQAAIHLEPAGGQATDGAVSPARGVVFESVGLPHPQGVRLTPGGDLEERILVRLIPAIVTRGDSQQTLWGSYKLSVDYSARFSNAEELERILDVRMWQGQVASNTIEVELQQPPAANTSSVEGTVTTADGRQISDALVSLSDQQERAVAQTIADPEGGFSFPRLPPGFYWVTARRQGATHDTTVFQHVVLSPGQPAAKVQLVMLPPEINKAQHLLHKPVFIRVTDAGGHPLSGVTLRDVWSTGTLLEERRAKVSEGGLAVLDLIPGRHFLTLEHRGCPKEDQRLDVAPGEGVDGSKLVLDCAGP